MTMGWNQSAGAGAVSTVFTRTGDVVATAGDYSTSLVSDASTAGGPTAAASLDALVTSLAAKAPSSAGWQSIEGDWVWTSTPQTVLTLPVAEGEAKSLVIYVNVVYYRTATSTFTSSGARIAVGSYRRAIGGSAVVNVAATLNAGTVATVSIAMLASGNNVLVNFGAGISTGESQVVYFDASYKLTGRTITY